MKQDIEVRHYQIEAVKAGLAAIQDGIDSIIVLPTGAGKSLVCGSIVHTLVKEYGLRVLLLSHRKELLVQDERAMHMIDDIDTGIYCAGLGRKESHNDVVLASVASVFRNPFVVGPRDVVVIDECHLIGRNANTMYGRLLQGKFRNSVRLGLSATPYRLDSGSLVEGKGALFRDIAIQVTARQLIDEGYLCPLVGIGADDGKIETDGIHKRAGEFITSELEQVAMEEKLIEDSAAEIIRLGDGRKSHLIFCVSVAHAKMMTEELQQQGMSCLTVWGDMPAQDREQAIEMLRKREISALTNVDVLTTGVDIPNIDCVTLLRPTCSKSRHIQSLGRGMRLSHTTGKTDCLVLDFGGNCERHGDIDDMDVGFTDFVDLQQKRKTEERKKAARETQLLNLSHDRCAAAIDPMLGGRPLEDFHVKKVSFQTWDSRNPKYDGARNLVVVYETYEQEKIRKWLCVEYTGNALRFAKLWFALRGVKSEDVPNNAGRALKLAQKLEQPNTITCRQNDRGFYEVVVEHFETLEDSEVIE